MKIEVTEESDMVLKEVYDDLVLETAEGNRLYICMRDNTFEMYIEPKGVKGVNGVQYRVNMETMTVEKL